MAARSSYAKAGSFKSSLGSDLTANPNPGWPSMFTARHRCPRDMLLVAILSVRPAGNGMTCYKQIDYPKTS